MRFEVSISEGGQAKWGSQCVISIYVTGLDRALGTIRTINRSALLRTSIRGRSEEWVRALAHGMRIAHVYANTHDSARQRSEIQVYRAY